MLAKRGHAPEGLNAECVHCVQAECQSIRALGVASDPYIQMIHTVSDTLISWPSLAAALSG